jgi:hypothetical protein
LSHKLLILLSVVFLVLHPLSVVQAQNSLAIAKEDFIGTWKGEGKVIVAWCEQKQLSFELQIDMDGNVSGKIGDAQILQGEIKLNNIVYRWLGNRKYIIDAKLTNYLIEKEKIRRESIRVFLDFENPFFVGGFHTSGSKFGGKEKMILSGSSLKLVKIMK